MLFRTMVRSTWPTLLQTELNKNLTLATWIKTTNSSRSEGIIAKYDTALGYGYVLRTTAAGKMELEIGTYNAAVYGNKIATDATKSMTANGTTSR